LPKLDPIDCRREIARAAGVSEGNVNKVRQILARGIPELFDALHAGELSIHRAWKWLGPPSQQSESLKQYRSKRALSALVDRLQRPLQNHARANGAVPDIQRLGKALANLETRESKAI